MPDAVLALNAGSSTIKFGLYAIDGPGRIEVLARGAIDRLEASPHFTAKDSSGAVLADQAWPTGYEAGLGDLLDWIEAHLGGRVLLAAGHRIVHGGSAFVAPVRLTQAVVQALDDLTPLAPLHQPKGLAPIRALASLRPGLAQIGCFDTAFHASLKPPVSRFALPRAYEESGVRRYGFHGLSYEFIAARLRDSADGLAAKRTVVAHLGNGCSLCAMRESRSVDTTMGFTALDGLMMGTRPGAIDPGILLHLQQARGMSVGEVEHLLYYESGLLGVSGISSDMRTLLASPEPHAAEAVDLFTFRIARDIAAMANTLQGLDCLVFTGGIGEHAAEVRAMVCERLCWLGAAIDPAANAAAAENIGSPGSRIDLRRIATDEEMTIARHVCRILGQEVSP